MELIPAGGIKFEKLCKTVKQVTTFDANAGRTFKALKNIAGHLDFIILYDLPRTEQALA